MTLKSINELSAEEFLKLIDRYKTILTDCDGVLWIEDTVIPGSPETINRLKEMGKNIYYITNNSSKTREQYFEKLTKMGFNASIEEIVNSAHLTACYLNDQNFSKKVYIFGNESIAQELKKFGIQSIGYGPDEMKTDYITYTKEHENLDENVGAVVVGFDEHFSYGKLVKAASYLENPECLFIATNADAQKLVNSRNIVVPGPGAVVNALIACTGRKPYIIGKPERHIQQVLTKKLCIDPKQALLIGDKCEVDIKLGNCSGFSTLLVLSGHATPEDLNMLKDSEDSELLPHYYIQRLSDLLTKLF